MFWYEDLTLNEEYTPLISRRWYVNDEWLAAYVHPQPSTPRVSLSVGLAGVLLSFVLGVILGGISGYYGGTADVAIQRLIEFLIALPTIPVWMALAAALPPGWESVKIYFGITIILSIVGWTGLARVVRQATRASRGGPRHGRARGRCPRRPHHRPAPAVIVPLPRPLRRRRDSRRRRRVLRSLSDIPAALAR